MDSNALASKLSDYNAHPVNSVDALNTAMSQYGVPEIRQTVSGLRRTVDNTTNALNNVDPSVTGRTQGSLVTEAQRQKQVTNERAPIAQNLRDQTTALGQNESDLTSALGQATTDANARVHDYEAGRAALQGEFSNALERERLAASTGASSDNSALLSALLGGNQPSGAAPTQPTASMTQRADKGFNFTDQNGNPINAAQYAHLTGQAFRTVLQRAADAGDLGSKSALNFVGNDYGYDPTKVRDQATANLYKALTGQNATIFAPAKPSTNYNILTTQGGKNLGNAITKTVTNPNTYLHPPSTIQQQLDAARKAGQVKKAGALL